MNVDVQKLIDVNDPNHEAHSRGVKRLLEEFATDLYDNVGINSIEAEDLCKSPIEKILLVAIANRFYFNQIMHSWEEHTFYVYPPDHGSPDVDSLTTPEWGGRFDAIFSQYQIGNYTADFVLRRYEWKVVASEKYRITGPKVVIECDGHDFHERTKEQAAHDKKCDRVLQAEGFHVLRFTGSEIFKDPGGCALQVDEFMGDHIGRQLASIRKSRKREKGASA